MKKIVEVINERVRVSETINELVELQAKFADSNVTYLLSSILSIIHIIRILI